MIQAMKKILPLHFNDYLKYLFLPPKNNFPISLKNIKKIFVMVYADYGNLGDIAIAYAQIKFLEDNFSEYKIIPVSISDTYSRMKAVKNILHKDDIITIAGGGNNGSLYPGIECCRMFVINQFPNHKVISFPQSFCITDNLLGEKTLKKMKRVYSSHKKLIITAREAITFQAYQRTFPTKAVLVPDIVMYLDKRSQGVKRSGAILCLRKDTEKKIPLDFQTALIEKISDEYSVSEYDTWIGKDLPMLEEGFDELGKIWACFSKSEFVVTDRLHGMIFSYITGTPCIVLPCSNAKISGSYEWLKNSPSIIFCEGLSPDEIINRIHSPEFKMGKFLPELIGQFKPLIDSIKN